MTITLPPLVDLLLQAIKNTAESASYLKRVHEGRTHEGFVIMAAAAIAMHAGLDVKLVEFESSSHALEPSNGVHGEKPDPRRDYQEMLLLEIQGHLLGLKLEYLLPVPGITVLAYQSRKAVQDAGFAFHTWTDVDKNEAMADAEKGIIELGQKNNLKKLTAALEQAVMEKSTTAIASKTQPGVRF